MDMRKPMTPTERMLFKEAVIREYQLKHETQSKKYFLINTFLKRLKQATPINIVIGIVACVILVMLEGWHTLVYILLFSIIWITLISTILGALVKTK